MNIYKRELRANRRSLLFWCLGMALLILTAMGKYSAMAAAGEQTVYEFINMLPDAMKAVMGLNGLDLTDSRSFFIVVYVFVALLAAIHASMLGAVIIGKEERDRTSEFLFVKPATRAEVITAKLLAALTNIAVLNLAAFIVSIAIMGKVANGQPFISGLALMMLGLFLLQIFFLSLGGAAAAAIRKPKASTGIAAGIMLFMFLLSSAIDINGDLAALTFLTPFKYFSARDMMLSCEFNTGYAALAVTLVAVLTALCYIAFRRRDLKI